MNKLLVGLLVAVAGTQLCSGSAASYLFCKRVIIANPQIENNIGGSTELDLLCLACMFGHFEDTKNLVKLGKDKIDINGRTMSHVLQQYTTPLAHAVVGEHLGIVKFLVDNGADVNQGGEYYAANQTPYFLARKHQDPAIREFLVKHGAKVPKTEAATQAKMVADKATQTGSVQVADKATQAVPLRSKL